MKLYYSEKGWHVPGQQPNVAKRFDIPTDSAGLCTWLNERNVHGYASPPPSLIPAREPEPELTTTYTGPLVPAAPAARPAAPSPDSGAEAIGDWIERNATDGEVHDLFMCLAYRFDKAIKAARS